MRSVGNRAYPSRCALMEKTLEIHLAELREKIAKDIEDGGYVWFNSESSNIIVRKIISQAAEYARGNGE